MTKKSAQKSKDNFEKLEDLRAKLKVMALNTKATFEEKYSDVAKELKERDINLSSLRNHSSKLLVGGALASTLLLAPKIDFNNNLMPHPPKDILAKVSRANSHLPAVSPATKLRQSIEEILPNHIRPLNEQEEKYLEKIVQEVTGIPAKASLEGEKLNLVYGKIGAEQHLRRYPGDVNENHAPDPTEYGGERPGAILKEGMAPGLGAWGYFSNSKEELTPELEETERWYSVAQTLYLPDWNTRQPYLKNWYKHRKLLIINTDNGKAVVTALADSGPAAWTGKHFGGSPEVMDYLGGERYKKGPVLVFFVDDPDNEIPLGPVEYNDVAFKLNVTKI